MPRDRAPKAGRTVFARVALGAAMLVLGVSAHAPSARAQEPDNRTAGEKFMDALGLKNPFATEYEINYSERSPLVVPPTRNLPPPVAGGPPPAPNWPKDPDINRQRQAKAEEKVTPHNDLYLEERRVLRPDELNVPGTTGAKVAAPGTPEQSPPPPGAKKSIFSLDWMNPNKEEYAVFTGERSRAALTDPPPGYLTPSPDQPYGVGKEKAKYKVKSVGDRMEPETGR